MKRTFAFTMVLFVFLAGCGTGSSGTDQKSAAPSTATGASNAAAEKKPVDIKISEPLRLLSFAPLYAAVEKGYFKEENINVEIISGGGGPQVMATLLSKNVQFGLSAPADIFKLIELGNDVVAIQALNTSHTAQIAVSNDYYQKKGFKPGQSVNERIALLKDAKMGAVSIGGSDEIFLRYTMHIGGLKPADIQVVRAGDVGSKIAGMKTAVIDGAINSPPFGQQAEEQNIGKIVLSSYEIPQYKNMVWEQIFALREYVDANPDVAVRLARALGKGMDLTRENPAETAKLVSPYFKGVDLKLLENSLTILKDAFKGHGEMNKEAWDNAQEPLLLLSSMTNINKKADTKPEGFWTNKYIEQAFKK